MVTAVLYWMVFGCVCKQSLLQSKPGKVISHGQLLFAKVEQLDLSEYLLYIYSMSGVNPQFGSCL